MTGLSRHGGSTISILFFTSLSPTPSSSWSSPPLRVQILVFRTHGIHLGVEGGNMDMIEYFSSPNRNIVTFFVTAW
jgi:hypothetical protein